MKTSEVIIGSIVMLAVLGWGAYIGKISVNPCPETLPTTVTDMFTVQGDTIYLKQDADFVISTRGIIVDAAGIIHRTKN